MVCALILLSGDNVGHNKRGKHVLSYHHPSLGHHWFTLHHCRSTRSIRGSYERSYRCSYCYVVYSGGFKMSNFGYYSFALGVTAGFLLALALVGTIRGAYVNSLTDKLIQCRSERAELIWNIDATIGGRR